MSKASRLLGYARLVPRLGFGNVLRVASYRARLACGYLPKAPTHRRPAGPLFADAAIGVGELPPVELLLFGWYRHEVRVIPDWHTNPLHPGEQIDPAQDWTRALAALQGRDPKPYWELSRFYWVPQFALDAQAGNPQALARLEAWLANWIETNPPFQGINWACGQEAAIRLMNLALAAMILSTAEHPTTALTWLIDIHVRRIRPTFGYALGQDNNHGSAEACALFIAASWGRCWSLPRANALLEAAVRWLNDRTLRLIQADGSPSQYSTTYHRANLETFCMAELWARQIGVRPFDWKSRQRVLDGARWLHRITNEATGDAPNLGANDGSHLLNLSSAPYRDFRQTVSLAACMFAGENAYSASDRRLAMLGLTGSGPTWVTPSSASSDDGGFHVLRQGGALAVLRYPRFRFRPSQADALHLDLTVDGRNILRDAGTFSYAREDAAWFAGTGAHNTAEFDGRDQMPRLGRFLYADWLRAKHVRLACDHEDHAEAAAGYRDARGASHHRHIVLRENRLICTDRLGGAATKAVLRWRLAPGEWQLVGNELTDGSVRLRLTSSQKLTMRLASAPESRYYLHRGMLPVLEVETAVPAEILTNISF